MCCQGPCFCVVCCFLFSFWCCLPRGSSTGLLGKGPKPDGNGCKEEGDSGKLVGIGAELEEIGSDEATLAFFALTGMAGRNHYASKCCEAAWQIRAHAECTTFTRCVSCARLTSRSRYAQMRAFAECLSMKTSSHCTLLSQHRRGQQCQQGQQQVAHSQSPNIEQPSPRAHSCAPRRI